jgi:hypothetical protein
MVSGRMQCYSAEKVQLVLLDQLGRVAASSATFTCRHSSAAQVFCLDDVWWVSEGHLDSYAQYDTQHENSFIRISKSVCD